MQTLTIFFRSYTDAMKAFSIFSESGMKTVYGKYTDPAQGCIHTLKINSEISKAEQILKKHGIFYYSVNNGGTHI